MQRDGVGSASYEYAANGNRFHEMASSQTTWFGPHGFERTRTPATTDRMELGPVTLSTVTSGPYLVSPNLRDRLGSTIAIGNANGTLAQTRSYDAFGEARNGDLSDRAGGTLGLLNVTLRGFTGHEHVDDARLIRMNGRMYDPVLGRFLSTDPVVQDLLNTQSQNPYSYVLNNPLAGLDPTGYSSCTVTGSTSCTSMNNDSRSADKVGHTTYSMGSDQNVRAYASQGGAYVAVRNSGNGFSKASLKGPGAQKSLNVQPSKIGSETSDSPTTAVAAGTSEQDGPLRESLGGPVSKGLANARPEVPAADPKELKFVQSIAAGFQKPVEYCALGCIDQNGNYSLSEIHTDGSRIGCDDSQLSCSKGTSVAFDIHNHLSGSFSANPNDVKFDRSLSVGRSMELSSRRKNAFSKEDMGGYFAKQRNGWLVPNDSNDLLYFPKPQSSSGDVYPFHLTYQFTR